ncbi:hypothetical protein [Corynebacterium bovis]|uniref:hypothetical protein n=2 Tax=Corynebacterium bovis TaxID=36808 RepID=UPI0021AB27A0|nr:hypothetical protein [Corynebacterium bovis]
MTKFLRTGRRRHTLGVATAVVAAVTALGAGTATATAQIPPLPDLREFLSPGQGQTPPPSGPGASDGDGSAPAAPAAPASPGAPAPGDTPAPPALPQLQLPQLPQLPPPPALPALPAPSLPPELSGMALPSIGGLDFAPPGPIPDMITPTGETYTVQSDSTALLGNVKLSYVSIDTMQGPRPAIRIDADRVVLDNLRVRFPGTGAGVTDVWQRSGPGQTTTLTGNFHIIVKSLTVTPKIAGVALPFAVPVDASWAPEQVGEELKKVGAGLPDAISDQTVMLNCTMETYYISSDSLVGGPGTTISA